MTEQLPSQQPQQNPGYSMPPHQEDEINLLDMLLVVVKRKRMILIFSFVVAVAVAGISLLLPNIYHAEVLVAPAQSSDTKSSGLSSLSGLASLAGVSIGTSGGSTEENLAVMQSREFLWQFVQENNLLPILFESQWDAEQNKWETDDPADQPGPFDVYRLMIDEATLIVSNDTVTGLVKIAIEWKDAKLAAEWANALVARANRFLAEDAINRSQKNLQYLNKELARTQIEEFRRTLFDLIASEQKNIMLASTQTDFAFRVLDPAMVPDIKIKPKRAIIVILSAFVAFFMAVVWAIISEGLVRASEIPEQEARIRELRDALCWRGRPK